ncbi:MAG TPA: outer membrane beta-barrel protein [Gemmatimonadaceae bacterium]|jgi:hypothetical protein
MIRSLSLLALSSLVALSVSPRPAAAQANPFHFNIAAGAAVPTGDLSDITNTGYNITGGLGLSLPLSPIGFRAEGFFNQFGFKDEVGGGHFNVGGANANIIVGMPVPSIVGSSLYGIGGIGWYNTHDDAVDFSENNIGFNIGAGFKFPLTGFSAYVEARYHQVSNEGQDAKFFPIVFGLVF